MSKRSPSTAVDTPSGMYGIAGSMDLYMTAVFGCMRSIEIFYYTGIFDIHTAVTYHWYCWCTIPGGDPRIEYGIEFFSKKKKIKKFFFKQEFLQPLISMDLFTN